MVRFGELKGGLSGTVRRKAVSLLLNTSSWVKEFSRYGIEFHSFGPRTNDPLNY